MVKFNVDGASKGNPGASGIGGVLRNVEGIILGYFSKSMGHIWAYEVEVHAIFHALLFCHEFNCHNVLIESDSTLAIGWTLDGDRRLTTYGIWFLVWVFNMF